MLFEMKRSSPAIVFLVLGNDFQPLFSEFSRLFSRYCTFCILLSVIISKDMDVNNTKCRIKLVLKKDVVFFVSNCMIISYLSKILFSILIFCDQIDWRLLQARVCG